jgi:prepilin-type N-terminal cleavage/methylation domain-containing protein/prepilin-type processing-associated H-X9-DG protein
MHHQPNIEAEKGFTLIELLVVIVIIAVLCGLILSTISKAKASSQGVACLSNLRQVGNAFNLYRIDHNNTYPMAWDSSSQLVWTQVLTGAAGGASYLDSRILKCPALNGVSGISYGMTSLPLWYPTLSRTDAVHNFFTQLLLKPAEWPLVMDADNVAVYGLDNPTSSSASDSRFAARHNGRANVSMVDGHIEQVQYGDTRWSQSKLNSSTYY